MRSVLNVAHVLWVSSLVKLVSNENRLRNLWYKCSWTYFFLPFSENFFVQVHDKNQSKFLIHLLGEWMKLMTFVSYNQKQWFGYGSVVSVIKWPSGFGSLLFIKNSRNIRKDVLYFIIFIGLIPKDILIQNFRKACENV